MAALQSSSLSEVILWRRLLFWLDLGCALLMLLPLAVELGGVLVDGLWASASKKCHSHHLMRYELLLCCQPEQRGWQMVWAVCWWSGGQLLLFRVVH
ncbi:hypothetical protein V6N11_058665 [Hibiscus sabdariffa]|uniref:Uncharacterized protein n=1 Tax=Hibiscus sabdariffa TaxID=183260 RepID=A0ABR2U4W5_9ROSI